MAALTNAEKLEEAEAALHALLTGKRSVEVGYGDTRVKFTDTNIGELRRYIGELRAAIDPCTYRRRPLGVGF